jgi:predicted nucleic acid-binding protein
MPSRVYADTSVFGGVFDPNFATDSMWVFEEAARGSVTLLVSDVLVRELSAAPEDVRKILDDSPSSAHELVLLVDQAEDLRDAYLAAKVVGPKRALDATHVAIATIARADALLSWDRRHIVGLARVQGYNRVNRSCGYQEVTIVTPTRYRAAQTRTP